MQLINRDYVNHVFAGVKSLSGIYKISNIIDDRCYIGSAVNIGKRFFRHLHDLQKEKHHSIPFQRFVNKYGIDSIRFILLETLPSNKEILLNREQYYIDIIKPVFNLRKTAESNLGIKYILTEKFYKALENRKGKPLSKEHCQNIGKALKAGGYKPPGNKGAKFSEVHKENLRKAQPHQRPIAQFKNGILIKEWPNVKYCAKSLNLHESLVRKVCQGKGQRKTTGGFSFKYIKDQP